MKEKKKENFKNAVRVFFSRGLVIKVCTAIMLVFVFCAIFAPVLTQYDPYGQDLTNTFAKSSAAHIMGTDNLGRDVLTRLLYGARISSITGLVSSIFACFIGTLLGILAGYYEGIVSSVIMRIIDAQMSIPPLILTMFMAMLFGKNLLGICVVIGIGTVPIYVRMLRGMVLTIRDSDYITAQTVIGQKERWIMLKHILPNCMAPIIVSFTMNIGTAIMIEASMAYLGVGIAPPTPAWGVMVSEGYKYLTSVPGLAIAPGVCIILVVVASNIVGDSLRDALDPKLRGKV